MFDKRFSERVRQVHRKLAVEFQGLICPTGAKQFLLTDALNNTVGFKFVLHPRRRAKKIAILGLGIEYMSLETKGLVKQTYWEDEWQNGCMTFEDALDICISKLKQERDYRIKKKRELGIQRKVGELRAIGITGIIAKIFGNENEFDLKQIGEHIFVTNKADSGAFDLSPTKDNSYRVVFDWNINREQLEKFLTAMKDL